MASSADAPLPAADRRILRGLAARVREIAEDPVMAERRRLWLLHNARRGERPMILAETWGAADELVPVAALQCADPWARGLERGFLMTIFRFERVRDDSVVPPFLDYNWHVAIGDYGVQAVRQRGDSGGAMGSYRWDAPIKDLDRDFGRLHPRTVSADREATVRARDRLHDVLGDILPPRLRGGFWWTMGLTWQAIDLIGLEGLMLAMCDKPAGLHRLMAFLRDDHLRVAEWLEREGLLTLNNEADYVGSGGMGYTRDLPQPDHAPGAPARLKDLWVLSESQETVGVSPAMFAEFVFPYQLPIVERFGLCYYGCCEPVHSRWDSLGRIPNLRTASVSPWCDQQVMAAALGDRVIFARKPNPALVSRGRFPEDEIRADVRRTLDVARGCTIEFALKDVHTLAGDPTRPGRWCDIVREEIDARRA
jgi:hypothetical protein